jgi:hypothetical protein
VPVCVGVEERTRAGKARATGGSITLHTMSVSSRFGTPPERPRSATALWAVARCGGYAHGGREEGFLVGRERGFDSHRLIQTFLSAKPRIRPQPERVSFPGSFPPPFLSERTVSPRVSPYLTAIAFAPPVASLASFWHSAVPPSCGRPRRFRPRFPPPDTTFALSFSESCGRISGRERFERTCPGAHGPVVELRSDAVLQSDGSHAPFPH